ncbi:MAG: hypothetical protein IJP68_12880 [Selenomonadaceae bacterium]|nr:hypothetical protein [Selenomonadaceae bacterium]
MKKTTAALAAALVVGANKWLPKQWRKILVAQTKLNSTDSRLGTGQLR